MLILDCNEEFAADESRKEELMEKVEEFLSSLEINGESYELAAQPNPVHSGAACSSAH